MKHLGFIVLAIVFCFATPSRAATNDLFSQGVAAFRSGQFPEAATVFKTAVARQPSAGLLVNLGLAEWQCGHAGAAILAWEQALWIDPFNAPAAHNLQFARLVAQVNAPSYQWFETASAWLPPNAWAWLAGGSLWLAVAAVTLPGILRRKKSGWLQTLAALGLGLFLFSITANYGVVSRTERGFILKRNAPLLLTPTRGSEVISTLNAGEPARRLRKHGGYYFIRTAYGSGWVEQPQVGFICP